MTLQTLENRYQIIRALGTGGFGDTFLAEDTHMPSGRRCVIKQLKPLSNDPQVYQLAKERFQREAVILEELGEGHSRIPRLYAYFETAGQFYLVQEYIEGATITSQVQKEGTLRESSVRTILVEILPVLDYIHSKRIIHRDIKPDNIILRSVDYSPVLIDFGAVKEAMGTMVTPSGHAASSIVIGTPGFMPGEQSAGRPVYPSDIYGLGLTAIYGLTGKIPQELETDPQTGTILWRKHAPTVSPSLAEILDRAVQYHPRDRYGSAKEMLEALQGKTAPLTPQARTEVSAPIPINSVPSPQATAVVAPVNESSYGINQGRGMRDWQKAILTGSVIGGFLLVGLFLLRPSLQVQNESAPLSSEEGDGEVENAVTIPPASPPSSITTKESPSTPVTPKIQPEETQVNSEKDETKQEESNNSSLQQKPSPDNFIQDHYAALNNRLYNRTWNNLTPGFKNKSGGFASYEDWWNSVESIDIGQVRVIEQSDTKAIVDAQLSYNMKKGTLYKDPKSRIELVWNQDNNSWSFADKYSP